VNPLIRLHPSARFTPQMILDQLRVNATAVPIKSIVVTVVGEDDEAFATWSSMTNADLAFHLAYLQKRVLDAI
jgi:hypothetical protein